jgi:hypothetical protein
MFRIAHIFDVTDGDNRSRVMEKIESIFEDIADVLLYERGDMGVVLKRRTRRLHDQQRRQNVPTADFEAERRIGFPGRTEKEAWEFSG